jgi:hypothetical protein
MTDHRKEINDNRQLLLIRRNFVTQRLHITESRFMQIRAAVSWPPE